MHGRGVLLARRPTAVGPFLSNRGHLLVAVAVLALLGSAAAAAWATAPGKNGKLAFRRYLSADHTWSVLFTANPDGTATRQITHPPRGVVDIKPDWSPDGRQLVFQRMDLNGCGPGCETDEIDLVQSDGSGLKRLAHDAPGKGCAKNGRPAGGICRALPAWSPHGDTIAFGCQVLASAGNPGFGRICVMNADGSNLRQLPQTPATGANDSAPQWSPDGRRIAFQRILGDTHGVFVMNADGGHPRRLTAWSLRGFQPDWSPDGRRIVFTSNHDGPPSVSANLYTIRGDGTGLRQLTDARGGKVQHLSATFSPDGNWITFSRTPGVGPDGAADIFVMRANGTQVRNVTKSAIWDSGTDWGPQG